MFYFLLTNLFCQTEIWTSVWTKVTIWPLLTAWKIVFDKYLKKKNSSVEWKELLFSPFSRKKIRRSAPETTLTISVLPLPLFSSFSLEVMWVYVQKKSHNFQQQHFRICISGRAEINIVKFLIFFYCHIIPCLPNFLWHNYFF